MKSERKKDQQNTYSGLVTTVYDKGGESDQEVVMPRLPLHFQKHTFYEYSNLR